MVENATLPPAQDRDPASGAPVRHRLYLVDGSGYIFRAYHALPPLTRKSDGAPVGAVSGFCNMLNRLLEDAAADGRVSAGNAAWGYKMPFDEVRALRGHLAFYPERIDKPEVKDLAA